MNSDSEKTLGSCIGYFVYLVVYLIIGYWAVGYMLEFLFDKTATFWQTLVLAFASGGFAIPAAFGVWLLKLFGIL